MAEPRVCIQSVRVPLLAAAARTGRPLAELAQRVRISLSAIGDATARVPHGAAIAVWEAMASASGDPAFGVFAAELVGAAPFDIVDLALAHTADVGTMVRQFLRYQALYHDANDARLELRGELATLGHRLRGELPRSRHLSQFLLAVWTTKLRRATGRPELLTEVRLRDAAPRDATPLERSFAAPLRFDAEEDALVFPRGVLELPVRGADPGLARTLLPQLEHEVRSRGGEGAFVAELRARVQALLGGGDALAESVARALGTSERTMQRRLREAGTSFRDVVDEVRREAALAQLGRRDATVTDIAFMLGFSDLSAFSRAFRRWTGASPSEYRR
ncbi:AraC family transcriptional regulator [Nannocystis punicea]|uniref:AraC family transcriptional regulator ligand-binding domain-containing protein n=1 Tax=Nannocystis punicea TaxID=2995304 RepID=A0ABY7GWP5_9BACT|nr:AraC family transcriptional regulator [Nannocystis poenicansa]WAS91368.1 AraC family transcriptional regulator ligand-binding domain-containing protein [Nannocystis poenicansa]